MHPTYIQHNSNTATTHLHLASLPHIIPYSRFVTTPYPFSAASFRPRLLAHHTNDEIPLLCLRAYRSSPRCSHVWRSLEDSPFCPVHAELLVLRGCSPLRVRTAACFLQMPSGVEGCIDIFFFHSTRASLNPSITLGQRIRSSHVRSGSAKRP